MSRLGDYDYDLPEAAIAQVPLEDRAAARLLWLHRVSGEVEHRTFRDLPEILRAGDLLVLNNTRVTALRLLGRKQTGGAAELLLLRAVSRPDVNPDAAYFQALAKPGRRLQPGAVAIFGGLEAEIVENLGHGQKLVRIVARNLAGRLREVGAVPLPPYITHTLADAERYQTVYSKASGSAAAPTAGLHFTREILKRMKDRGIRTAFVTLDVGIDTFKPVQSEDLSHHTMHGERCTVPEDTVRAVEQCVGRVIAVGTTSVRTLESFAVGKRKLNSGEQVSRLFIQPGFDFQIVDGMLTNFHLPRTTMLIMLAALAGRENVLGAYGEALKEGYRFLSFGDSMLIL